MLSTAPKITDAGKNLLLRAIGGETITFTRFKIGNGEISSETDIDGMTELINPLVEFEANAIDLSEPGFAKVTGTFGNNIITDDFRWRELGLYCHGEDDVEILYAYANDGENAGMLKANMSDVVIEQTVSVVIAIGDAEHVTAKLSESTLYESKEDAKAHYENTENPHNVTKKQLGLENVENAAVNDQTPTYTLPVENEELTSGETMSTAFGKIARAIKSVIAHLTNLKNPHGVTITQIGAAKSEHNHSAADINSGVLSVERGGTGVSSLKELKELLGTYEITGTYVGNGENFRLINLGRRPTKVEVICDDKPNDSRYNGVAFSWANAVPDDTPETSTDISADVSENPGDYYHDVKVGVVDNGFYVFYCDVMDSHPRTNYKKLNYRFIANFTGGVE